MKKKLIIFSIIFYSFNSSAQTGIGTTTPNASAKLDVYSTNKGFLPPRVTLTSATDAATIVSPAEGLLIYNLGSVGLQAGYYYWNSANWATIATASSAGNGVTATNMVNLYAKAYSTAAGDIANSSGYSFTVPVSGRYLFDFSCTGYSNATITYKVRQGTTDIGTDAQTSYNNTVHVEYNGKIEVNLQSGVTYNVYVNSTGNRDLGDYDRVYYKLVAGNLPVTGQSVEYVSVSTISQSSIGDNRDLIFTTNNGGNIPYNSSTGVFTLSANKTYLFQAQIRANTPSANGNYIEYGFVDATSNTLLVNGTQTITSSTTSTAGFGSNPVINFIYTPTSNQTVKLRTTTTTVGTQNIVSGTANITQIGSSAIINPWTLSGTNTFNTTGNVGIGTNSPTEKFEVSGNVKATNFIGTASSATLYLLEANASVTYTMPGSYTSDPCRYSIVNNTVNVPSSWFNTSTYAFTPQKAGYWEIAASYDVYRNSESSLTIQKNGSNVAVAGTLSSVVQQIRKIVYLNGSTDYINVINSGFNSNSRSQNATNSWFQARWVGE